MIGGKNVSRTIRIYVTQPPALLQKSRDVAIRRRKPLRMYGRNICAAS